MSGVWKKFQEVVVDPLSTLGSGTLSAARGTAATTPAAGRPDAIETLRMLQDMFPSWDAEAIKDVIIQSKGNVDLCIETLLKWTADDAGTSKSAITEQQERDAASYEDLLPPPVEERKLLDTILASRMNWKVAGEEIPMVMVALSKMKILASRASEKLLLRQATGDRGSFTPVATSDSPDPAELSREAKIQAGKKLLNQRLGLLNLAQVDIVDDGNCQFRSFSMELFGTQAYHQAVRTAAVNWLRAREEEYSAFVPENMSWPQYLEAMIKPRYWGDQLTMIAVAHEYGATVHMITTEQENWHHLFEPEEKKWPYRHLFLAYISPIHYNTIKPLK